MTGPEEPAQRKHRPPAVHVALPRPISDALVELIAQRLRVLGQPVRIRLLDELDRNGEASVRELAGKANVSAYNASQQLGVLRQAGIVERDRRGRAAIYRIIDPTTIAVYERVAAGLAEQAARLERRMRTGS